jgi:hypothetical protein
MLFESILTFFLCGLVYTVCTLLYSFLREPFSVINLFDWKVGCKVIGLMIIGWPYFLFGGLVENFSKK